MNALDLANSIQTIYHWTHINKFISILESKKISSRDITKRISGSWLASHSGLIYFSTDFDSSDKYFHENHNCGDVNQIGACRIGLKNNDYLREFIVENYSFDEDIILNFYRKENKFLSKAEVIKEFDKNFKELSIYIENKDEFRRFIIDLYDRLQIKPQEIAGSFCAANDIYNNTVSKFHNINRDDLLCFFNVIPPSISFKKELGLSFFSPQEISIEYRFMKNYRRGCPEFISIRYDNYSIESKVGNSNCIQVRVE